VAAKGAAVEVTGAKELRKAMKHMGADLKDMTKANKAAAQPVYERSKDIVPRVSGVLGRSIRVSATRTRASILAGKGGVPYAGPIHYGWRRRNIEPQPFLTDALAEKRSEVVDIYGAFIGDLVKRLDRETPE
jgi:HK97 gp10 family phage protein